jgi:hypothetical protein
MAWLERLERAGGVPRRVKANQWVSMPFFLDLTLRKPLVA